MVDSNTIDVVISFDTTGSMYPCLTEVRQNVEGLINQLFVDVPNIRIGLIAHGDYCDGARMYSSVDLTDDRSKLVSFIRRAERTSGGDAEECYEYVINRVRSFSWAAGKSRAFILIGDDVPHGPSYPDNKGRLDWRNELKILHELGVKTYPVQALARRHADLFYDEMARIAGTVKITLDQFSYVADLIKAITYAQLGNERVEQFEQQLKSQQRTSRTLDRAFSAILGRSPIMAEPVDKSAVALGRFQLFTVGADQRIDDFVNSRGIVFSPGRGFYQFTKRETIQPYKEVIAVHKRTGDTFVGDEARRRAGIAVGGTSEAKFSPQKMSEYDVYVQSTSMNRKLIGGTKFLYEVGEKLAVKKKGSGTLNSRPFLHLSNVTSRCRVALR
jgi:hypothetical protein